MMRKPLIDYGSWAERKVNELEEATQCVRNELDNIDDSFDPSDTTDAEEALEVLKDKIYYIESVLEACKNPPEFAPDFDPIPNSNFLSP